MDLPKITSTTELQRNISVITEAPEDELQIITKGKKEIGVYIPTALFKEKYQLREQAPGYKKVRVLPPKTLKALRKIDPVKYQRDIREEY